MTDPRPNNSLQITRSAPGPLAQWRSARGFEWTRLDLPVPDLSPALNGLRIIHLSDFHCRRWWDPAYDDLIARLRASPPDLILFTGDFVESKFDSRPAMPTVQKLFTQLPSRLGTFAILGNHDGDLVGPTLATCNVNLIDHRRVYLQDADAAIELIGLPGVDRFDLDRRWVNTLGKKRPGSLRISLGHYPDMLGRTADLAPDLYLTGHTHGGQIAWFDRLPILRHDTLPRQFCTGIHRIFGTTLVVNRGLGFTTFIQLRVFCPSEVGEIVVHGA